MATEEGFSAAAVGALLSGDRENFLVATTEGGVEAQEAQGQRKLVADQTLPRQMGNREIYEKWGIEFGQAADDIFVFAILPEGWEKKPTEHSMWSDLVDEKGRKRAGIFYKAAFYDRSAKMTPCRYYSVEVEPEGGHTDDYASDREKTQVGQVFSADGEVVCVRTAATDSQAREKCGKWLDSHKPDWEDARAYWDES